MDGSSGGKKFIEDHESVARSFHEKCFGKNLYLVYDFKIPKFKNITASYPCTNQFSDTCINICTGSIPSVFIIIICCNYR